jgi:uncharacterized membrane protein
MRAASESRDRGLDALRGLAIVAMVASHLAREVLSSPHPMWLRVFSSIAAPLFITLAGMLTAQTSAHKQYPLGYYLHRGGVILLLAALVDVVLWGIYPFLGCDVLYLIGVAVPLAACFARLSFRGQACWMAAVVLLPRLLRPLLGYPEEVFSVALSDSPWDIVAGAPLIAHQWLLTGWFPLLPWLGFSFLGVWLFRWRQAHAAHLPTRMRIASLAVIALGLIAGWLSPSQWIERVGYTELFYPPTLAYVLVAAGAVLGLFSLAGWTGLTNNQPLVQLGRCPLLMYLVHLALLEWAIQPLVGDVELAVYLLLYAALLLILVGVAGAVSLSKQRSTRRLPFMLRLLLGS